MTVVLTQACLLTYNLSDGHMHLVLVYRMKKVILIITCHVKLEMK